MRQLLKEKREVWVADYAGKEPVVDGDGRLTGEYRIAYAKPFRILPSLSPRSGNNWADGFGVGVDCDRTAVIDETGTGVTDTCVLWVETTPELDSDGNLALGADGTPETPFDYRVSMVAESYNFTAVAMKKAM